MSAAGALKSRSSSSAEFIGRCSAVVNINMFHINALASTYNTSLTQDVA